MAFYTDLIPSKYGTDLIQGYCSINSFQSYGKDEVIVTASVWDSKQHKLDGRESTQQFRFFVANADLNLTNGVYAGLYEHLMQQPEFSNCVADIDDDFPVTPIG